jgi:hypothetical protein
VRVIMFQDRFAAKVADGAKRQTIRKTARCKVGDTLSLRRWSGKPYRSKQAVLREAVVERVREVEINHYDVFVDEERFPGQHLAVLDGFKDFEEMRDWFSTVHGLPFRGQLIQWSNAQGEYSPGATAEGDMLDPVVVPDFAPRKKS